MPHDPIDLPLRTRETFDGSGESRTQRTVFCPARDHSVDADRACQSCGYGGPNPVRGATDLQCAHPAAQHRPADAGTRAAWMSSERTSLRTIMTRDVACVTADLAIDAFATLLLERNIGAAPVVDARGRAIGVASKTDLVRWYRHEAEFEEVDEETVVESGLSVRKARMRTVNDLMTPLAFTLGEEAPIAYAAALMTMEGTHHLPIVGAAGEVVGIVSALDLVRWIAQRDGLLAAAGR